MNETNMISVIIPTYNRGQIIQRAIHSVLEQTFPYFELIVVDDGSKDDTAQVVGAIAQNDERVRYVYQENQGAQVARNHGLRMACGEFVCFFDSDDEWLPTYLEKMVDVFRKDPSIGCVYCLIRVKNSAGTSHIMLQEMLQGDIYAKALEQGYITAPSALTIKKSCFDHIGEWDINFFACQDDDMCFRLAKHYRFSLIQEPLVVLHTDYDGNENRISASAARVANGWWQLWRKHEAGVLDYCGRRTMAKHYLECAMRFRKSDNTEMQNKALKKASEFYAFDNEWDEIFERLSGQNIYCYGIGTYGLIVRKFFPRHLIEISAFVVSEGKENPNLFGEYPVIYHTKIPFSSHVFLTCSQAHHSEIMGSLSDRRDLCVHTIPEALFIWMNLQI